MKSVENKMPHLGEEGAEANCDKFESNRIVTGTIGIVNEVKTEMSDFEKRWGRCPEKNENVEKEVVEYFREKFGECLWKGFVRNIWTDRHNFARLSLINWKNNPDPSVSVPGGESEWYFYNSDRGVWQIDYNEVELSRLILTVHDDIRMDWERLKRSICSSGSSEKDSEKLLEKEEKKYHKCQERVATCGTINKYPKSLQSESAMSKHISEFDADSHMLNCANGIVDLKTGKIVPHSREQLFIKQSSVSYDPKAKCPRWLLFLEEVFGGDAELISYIKRAVGYSLTGEMSEQVFFLLNGSGSNGKSTFLEILALIFGDYQNCADIETFIRQNQRHVTQDLATLKGARLVSSTEPQTGKYWNEDRIKKITGEDRLKVRYLYGREFEDTPTYKLWFATNAKPRFNAGFAFTRRIRLVQFSQTFSVEKGNLDTHLKEKLAGELAGILNWAVEGAIEWYKHGLGNCKSVETNSASYAREQDILLDFIEEKIVRMHGKKEKEQSIYSAYSTWCQLNGINHPLSKKEMMREFEARGFERYKPGNVMTIKNIELVEDRHVQHNIDDNKKEND
jgi:putative DNA primase/helicase